MVRMREGDVSGSTATFLVIGPCFGTRGRSISLSVDERTMQREDKSAAAF